LIVLIALTVPLAPNNVGTHFSGCAKGDKRAVCLLLNYFGPLLVVLIVYSVFSCLFQWSAAT